MSSHNPDRRSKLETARPTQLHSSTGSNENFIKTQSLLQALHSCKFNLWWFFFLGKSFWILSSMLTLSFILSLGSQKISAKNNAYKNKSIHRKITLFFSLQDPIFKQRSTPPLKALCVKILVIPSQIYEQNNQNFDPSIIKLQAVVHIVNRTFLQIKMLLDLSNCSAKTV